MTLNVLFSIGIIFLTGVIGATLIKYLKLPNITSYIFVGILIGPELLDLISPALMNSTKFVTNVALSFIAFGLGQNFSIKKLQSIGSNIVVLTIGQMVVTFLLVGGSLYMLPDISFHMAILAGAIATASAPIAVITIIREYRSKGNFTDNLLGVVAFADGGSIILFAVILAVARGITQTGGSLGSLVVSGFMEALVEIGGAILVGVIIGAIFSKTPKYVDDSIDILLYILGFVLLTSGVALHFGFSALLANMTLGIYLENRGESEFRFFDALKDLETPFYLLFFVLAGAKLELEMLKYLPAAATVYIITRIGGKVFGSYLGAVVASAKKEVKKYLGMALIPQAGVAIGFALIVQSVFQNTGGEKIFLLIISTTVVNEIIGPVFTKIALQKSGEIRS
ncbi:MAG: cation:proton antiporter [Elusimicrobiota bacterium]